MTGARRRLAGSAVTTVVLMLGQVVGLAVLGGALSACATAGGERGGSATPRVAQDKSVDAAVTALTQYRDALAQGRPDDAWALLAPGTMDRDTFRAFYADHRRGLLIQAEELLRTARQQPPAELVTVRWGDAVYELVRTPAGWRIRSVHEPSPQLPASPTPPPPAASP